MKFTVAVVVLALAVGAQSSVLPLAWGGVGHGWAGAHDDGQWHGDHGSWDDGSWNNGWAGHGLIGGHGGQTLVQGHQVVGGWAGHGPAAVVVDAGHGLIGGHGPAAVVVDAGHGHGLIGGHGGQTLVQGHQVVGGWAGHGAALAHGHGHGHASYVASNRGSVHVAPLAGHIQSVASSNNAPAPGTNW